MSETLIDLIRHGEPAGGHRYRGHGIDDPLSATGWMQMERALRGSAPWNQVLSSPLHRCRAFAADLAGRHRLPLAIDHGLVEIGMGAWEGRSHDEIADAAPEQRAAVLRDPVGCRPPGGEPLLDFQARIMAVYTRQLDVYPNRHLLIVCHAGVTRAIVGQVLGAGPAIWYRLRVDHAGITRIRHTRHGAALECLNSPILPYREPA